MRLRERSKAMPRHRNNEGWGSPHVHVLTIEDREREGRIIVRRLVAD